MARREIKPKMDPTAVAREQYDAHLDNVNRATDAEIDEVFEKMKASSKLNEKRPGPADPDAEIEALKAEHPVTSRIATESIPRKPRDK